MRTGGTSSFHQGTIPATVDAAIVHKDEAARGILSRVYTTESGAGRVRAMEGARGVAVLLVFFVHFHALFGQYAREVPVLAGISEFLSLIGKSGVDIFFLISGYVIYGFVLRRKATFGEFIRRRLVRLYPTFFVVFVLYLVLALLFPETGKIRGSAADIALHIAANLLWLPGLFDIDPVITVSWSLSFTFCFYLSIASLVYGLKMWEWKPWKRIALIGGLYVAYLFVLLPMGRLYVRMLMFSAGILLYEWKVARPAQMPLRRRGEIAAILFFAASLGYVYLIQARDRTFPSLPAWFAGEGGGVLIRKTLALYAGCFGVIAYAFHFDGLVRRFLCRTPIRYLGNMSYSYFLVHGVTLQAVLLVFAAIAGRYASAAVWAAALCAGFAASWVTSTALYVLVEKPFSLNLGRGVSANGVVGARAHG